MLLDDEGKNTTKNFNKYDNLEKSKNLDNIKEMDEKRELEECLVCFDPIDNKKYVMCKLCNRKCHTDCYKRFVKKSPFFNMKCFQCQTKSVKFKKKIRYNLCCFC